MDYSKTANKLKGEILSFADDVSAGLTKPERRAVTEILFGMLTGGSCLVTEVSRGFIDSAKFTKVLQRLTRHLSKEGLGKRLQTNYLQKIKKKIR